MAWQGPINAQTPPPLLSSFPSPSPSPPMLPKPAAFSQRGGHYARLRSSSVGREVLSWRQTLQGRSRMTNFAVTLGALFCACSLLLNLHFYASAREPVFLDGFDVSSSRLNTGRLRGSPPLSILSTLNPRLQGLDHLIVVAGHAIWQGCSPQERLHEEDWVLEPIQREQHLLGTFFKHISKGSEMALNDAKSLLVFSGGQTRPSSLETEATSYLRLAHDSGILGKSYNSSAPFPRATTESFALDSFQNVLFSIARFHEITGGWPKRITVVSFGAKKPRFVELHAKALRWDPSRFDYVGIDPEAGTAAAAMFEGEKQFGYAPYSKDLYGCHADLLAKRRKRNPFHRFHSYYTSAPELTGLLDYCPGSLEGGQDVVYRGSLPWSS